MKLDEGEEPNGTFVEEVLQCVKKRLEFDQMSVTACEENARAVEHVEAAIREMESRRDRMNETNRSAKANLSVGGG